MTREEHLQWAKQRALECVERGDTEGAYASIVSDLRRHPETIGHAGIMPGMIQMMGGHLSTRESMRHFIEGFN
jgi:hypothetical protein